MLPKLQHAVVNLIHCHHGCSLNAGPSLNLLRLDSETGAAACYVTVECVNKHLANMNTTYDRPCTCPRRRRSVRQKALRKHYIAASLLECKHVVVALGIIMDCVTSTILRTEGVSLLAYLPFFPLFDTSQPRPFNQMEWMGRRQTDPANDCECSTTGRGRISFPSNELYLTGLLLLPLDGRERKLEPKGITRITRPCTWRM